MNWKEKLKHYQVNTIDNIKDNDLLAEAIATCENYFYILDEEELNHHSRALAICYLALKHQEENQLRLEDIKTLKDVARENDKPFTTLQHRLKNLKEGKEYRGLGKRMPTILTPGGVEKIIRGRNNNA